MSVDVEAPETYERPFDSVVRVGPLDPGSRVEALLERRDRDVLRWRGASSLERPCVTASELQLASTVVVSLPGGVWCREFGGLR